MYVYGIIPTYYPAENFRELDRFHVINIPYRKISAIVSESSVIDYKQLGTQPLAKLLIDHQKMIESIMNIGFTAIIPMRLGTFVNNTSKMLKILEKGYDLIMEIMENIVNMVEIELVSTWADFDQVLLEISTNQQVIEMKTEIEERKKVTQSDQLIIGYLIKRILDETRKEYAKNIINVLEPICKSSRQHEVLNDQMISNTAFLINQSKLDLFEQTLNKLDTELNRKVNFKLVGPLPCYSFYTLEVKELDFNEIEEAKKELGLNALASEKKIKQAYLNKVKLFHPDKNSSKNSTETFNRIKKAYQTMLDYINAVKPASFEEQFSLLIDAVSENLFFLRIKE